MPRGSNYKKPYTPEFRCEAVALYRSSGRSLNEVAAGLGVSPESLRVREFVDAARSLGGRGPYILFRELLPNLVGPILVYATLLIPTNILFEAALDYLGVGLIPPTPSWGQMLATAVSQGYYAVDPMYMIIPGVAIFITIMAFNLFGDGLRDALDPRSR